ncbi:hypothetical protein FSARC_14384 [Fusarium sarcochroum]|uniref:Zn(2)-C6 fungal-type domain-containing protein n=1 Tax=Fusarium sarcochroum TaxID=1208366 RepID=A0A8H4STY8_9HYPO|nr:hypothetical protein FSARC_14384 [Fusarium sarcochroum]
MGLPRRRSCTACVSAKRRCSLDLPSCERCVDRAVGCVYPWMAVLGDRELLQQDNYSIPQSTALDLHHATPTASSTPIAAPRNIVSWPLVPGMLSQISDLASQNSYVHLIDVEVIPAAQLPIRPDLPVSAPDMRVYLNRDWASEGPISQGSVLQPRAEYATRRFANQSLAFAQFGQTPSIHHTQIEASELFQDTLAASALNTMRNVHNAAVIRREINRRVSRLYDSLRVKLNAISANASGDGADLLPAPQSMMIYQCIRLFSDNEPNQRARAEHDLQLIRILISHLISSVKPVSEDEQCFLWIEEESLRRTILVAELLIGVHSFLRYRTHILSWEIDIHKPRPEDLEELGMLIRGTYLGLENLEEWLGWKHHALFHWGLRGA